MSREIADRRLAGPEIELIVHLLRCDGAAMLVTIPASGRELGAQLWRMGLVHVWYRRSLASSRLEGGFYSLTRDGTFRAEHLMLARQSRPANRLTPTYDELYSADHTPPPAR